MSKDTEFELKRVKRRVGDVKRIVLADKISGLLNYNNAWWVDFDRFTNEIRVDVKGMNDDKTLFKIKKYIMNIYNNCNIPDDKDGNKKRCLSLDKIICIILEKHSDNVFRGKECGKEWLEQVHMSNYNTINRDVLFLIHNKDMQQRVSNTLMQIVMNSIGFKKTSTHFNVSKLVTFTGYTPRTIKSILSDLSNRNVIAITNTADNNKTKGIITINPDFYLNPFEYFKDIVTQVIIEDEEDEDDVSLIGDHNER